MVLQSYIEPFLNYCSNLRGYSPQTVKSYKISLNALIEHHEIEENSGTYTLNIMPLRIHLQNHSKKAVAAKLSAIRSFVKYINDYQEVKLKLKSDQSIKVPKTLPKPIEDSAIVEVFNSCDLQTKTAITMLYGLGLRISELASLKLSNISKNWVRVTGKGNKTREIPLLPFVYTQLQEYIAVSQPKIYIFEKEGKPLSDGQLRYKIGKAFKKHGIKATPHQLRHAFATELLKSGARIADVSELLGHSSMATTQIYTKLTSSTKLKSYLSAHPLVKTNYDS